MKEPTTAASRAAPGRPNYLLHLGLFVTTCFTTTWAGVLYRHPAAEDVLAVLAEGLAFSVPLMGILLTHEMGHFVLGLRHRVPVSLPYFIPLPPNVGIGTLGAVIAMGGVVRRRDALLDIGAAGPIAGLVVAVPVLAYGIHLSEIKPVGPGLLEGNSVLYLTIKLLVKGAVLPGNGVDVQLHPVAWAGWVGFLVTMLNLLPIGQLDGGHVAVAYFGPRHNRASRALHLAMPVLGVLSSAYTIFELSHKIELSKAALMGLPWGIHWFVWALLLLLMRRMSGGVYHPPVDDDPLGRGRRVVCVAMLIVFLLIFTPIPLRPTL